ncbi:MAG: helix-turn-helix transcriptional regulator [Cyanothece sp. SIO1E1]|nr:helix-turn-helix transcriptional regulator [Cyanothece sp. SIO1E1]
MQPKISEDNFRSQCSISCALEIIGDKWSLLIVRDAMILGKTSFNEFRHSKEKIASNILASRLAKLVDYGIFEKKENAIKKSKIDYVLTDLGRSLKPILIAIGNWGYENISGVNDSAAYFNAKG